MTEVEANTARGRKTRLRIVSEAASLFHHKGYVSTGLEDILEHAGITKGSFYHHFQSKKEVALAVIHEIVAEQMQRRMITPVVDAPQPMVAIRNVLSCLRREVSTRDLLTGCPINNLASELALQDEEFRGALAKIFSDWERAWTKALRREFKSGRSKDWKDPREFSLYLISAIEGAQAMAKAQQSRKPIDVTLKHLEATLANF